MNEDVRNPRNKQRIEPSFDDARYAIDMRVDKLTTLDAMRTELSEIRQRAEERQMEIDKRKAEAERSEREEYEAWKASKKAEQDGQVE